MAADDTYPTFTPPRTGERPCLTNGNRYTRCVGSCQFLSHDGKKKPGCIFFPTAGSVVKVSKSYEKKEAS